MQSFTLIFNNLSSTINIEKTRNVKNTDTYIATNSLTSQSHMNYDELYALETYE